MKSRRRQLVIDPALQYKLGAMVLGCGLVASAISMIGLKILSRKVMDLLEQIDTNKDMQLKVISEFNEVSLYYIFLTVLSIGWAWAITLYLTNRVVGPVHNMMNTLDRVAEGDKAARVILRKKDFFQPLADKINKALDERA